MARGAGAVVEFNGIIGKMAGANALWRIKDPARSGSTVVGGVDAGHEATVCLVAVITGLGVSSVVAVCRAIFFPVVGV